MLLAAATVNWNDVLQTIDGFGASSAWMWGTIPQTALDQLYSATSGAGLSLLRSHIYPQGWSSETGVMQQVAPYGVTVWSTPWSPPRDWKTNNDNNHGGYLDPSHYQDYATQLATYALNMKALGVPLYAISLQNEPDMNVDYESCLWTEDQFAAFMPVVGETFAARGVTAKIMLPENSNWSFDKANSIMANPNLSMYVGILAAHNYDQTYHPYVTVNGTGGLPLWQTEVYLGAGVSEITDALTLSNDIHTALTVGGASAYHYWWLSAGGVGGLMGSNWVASKRLWAMGQYSRFVRPGWVMIGETDDGGLDITTFKNPASGEFAIVASNSGTTNINETFTFNGFTTASVTPYITSGTAGDDIKQYANITTTAGGSFVGAIAANSIVTYTGFSSDAPTLQAPTNLRALPQYQNQTTQIALSWDDNSTTESDYTVERSTDGNTWSVITSTLGINTMSYVDTGRTENTLYYYRVKATNGATSSPYSAVVSCRTILAAPWSIGTRGSNPSGVNLIWNNSSDVSTGTTIERSLDGLTWTLIATLTDRTTWYTDTIPGYNANQLYCYRIRNTAGNVVSAYASYNTALKAPTSFTASSIGATQITFTWVNNTSSSIGNWIEQYNPSTSSWNTVSPTNLAGSANSYTITGLTEKTSYRFRLRASAAGDSIWSAYTAEATPTTLFAAPTNLKAIAASSTQTNLVWTDNSAIETNYTVECSTNGTSWTVLSSTLAANTTSYSDNSTPTGTVYYRVKATTSTASSIYATTQRIAAAPVITATPNPVTGTTAALSVPALVGFGNGSLTYTWSTDGTPPAPVTFSVNGTSTSNSATATFTKSGAYTFRIVVTDSAGLSTTNTLAVTVNQTLTTITVTAIGDAIVKSTWQQCTATAYDQFGFAMTMQPTFTWSVVSGGGSISSAGLYAAPSSAATPVVKAAFGSISGLLTLSVLDTAQLKAVYSFNEGSGNTAHDQLGVGVDGILSWGVNYTTGRLGDALQFDGSTGSVWLGNPASLDIVGQITMAAWIKPTSSSGIQNIVGRSYGSWPNQAETVLRINAGKYEVGIWNGATTVASYSVPAGDINTWVHLVGTYDGKTWRLYRNGTLVATATTSIGSMHILKAWRIGSSDVPDRYVNGCIDSVRLYAQALTASEVSALAAQTIVITSPVTASPSPVVGTTTNLAVAAIDPDSNSDANFIYTWSAIGTPPAAVSFSDNGAHAAKNTTATFTNTGDYIFTVTITDAYGLTTASTVNVTVNQMPKNIAIAPSGGAQFTVNGTDQFGNALPSSSPFTWPAAGLTLQLAADANLHIYQTGTTTNVVPPYAMAGLNSVNVDGLNSGGESLTIDLSGGQPIPAGGITFNGGAGGGNSLFLIGSPGGNSAVMSAAQITDNGLAPIYYSNALYFGFDFVGGTNSLLINNATLKINQNNAISADTNVTIDGGILDLNGKTDTIGDLLLKSGSILSGTLHANAYNIESGIVTAAISGTGDLLKTTTGQATVGTVNTTNTTVSGGELIADSIVTGTLTVGAGSVVKIAPDPSGPLAGTIVAIADAVSETLAVDPPESPISPEASNPETIQALQPVEPSQPVVAAIVETPLVSLTSLQTPLGPPTSSQICDFLFTQLHKEVLPPTAFSDLAKNDSPGKSSIAGSRKTSTASLVFANTLGQYHFAFPAIFSTMAARDTALQGALQGNWRADWLWNDDLEQTKKRQNADYQRAMPLLLDSILQQ